MSVSDLKLPTQDNLPISFVDTFGGVYEGLFIKSEEMFFIGFDDVGDFRFKHQVVRWEKLSEEYCREKGIEYAPN